MTRAIPQNFKNTFARLSTTSLERRSSNDLGRSTSWISFPSFLDDSFNLSHTSIASYQLSEMGTLSDITNSVSNRQSQTHATSSKKRRSLQPLDDTESNKPLIGPTMSDRSKPRYMTPTFASKAQKSTPQSQSRPTTPASAGSNSSKGRGWMANAGRRLGISTPGSKNEGKLQDKPSIVTNSPKQRLTAPMEAEVRSPFPQYKQRLSSLSTRN